MFSRLLGSRGDREAAHAGALPAVGRGQDADIAFGLLRIDGTRQVVRFGAFAQLFKGDGLNPGVADIDDELQALTEVVGALHNDVKSLDALGGHVTLGGNLCLTAVEIHADQYLELLVQKTSPLLHGRDAATGYNPSVHVTHVTEKFQMLQKWDFHNFMRLGGDLRPVRGHANGPGTPGFRRPRAVCRSLSVRRRVAGAGAARLRAGPLSSGPG